MACILALRPGCFTVGPTVVHELSETAHTVWGIGIFFFREGLAITGCSKGIIPENALSRVLLPKGQEKGPLRTEPHCVPG